MQQCRHRVILFQFLHGAIKSYAGYLETLKQTGFQFLHGAIKRLVIQKDGKTQTKFQFLHGAIKSE